MTPSQVWQQLTAFYPEITIEFGFEPTEHWCRAIESLSQVEIQRALDRLRIDPPSTRPNALEFVELARPPSRRRYTGPLTTAAERHACVKPASREAVEKHLANMRAALSR